MIILQFILSLFFWIYFQFSMLVMFLLSYPIALLPGRGREVFYFLVRWILRILFTLCFIRVKISNAENIPQEGRLVFFANHPVLFEPLYLIAFFPLQFRIVADEQMFSFPLLGRIVKMLGVIPYPKKKKKDRKQTFIFAHSFFSALRENEPILIFPDNLRSKNREVKPFKQETLEILKKGKAFVVPLALTGVEKVSPVESMLISPGEVKIIIGHSIKVQETENLLLVAGELESYYRAILNTRM